ncbi:methylated-DNA--[protein]-cysteine S-methyltransferase [Stappia sp. GBMRC 2046]|uniref:Methylated-DNA--protein-cysteine methyltransferase n=1 Tax=Stappia sediminis TaxID=2692190 RepID=A0A7X3LUC1_9HYPH|nr:methylated-DNA--[protein]-cysteine S-methyltransferase [Stappia sediminis]MXN65271.1 methylated-DNA--[protein]-cysteine S-methyltransferase [Stappia sediminis]
MPVAAVETPVGCLGIVEEDGAIVELAWDGADEGERTPLLDEAVRQMNAYFAGELTEFDLPLKPRGNEFQQAVYRQMLAIPYGETRTYGQLAKELDTYGQPIGQACGMNPIPVIIPCHRVLSANGIGGYSGQGGVEMKIALLRQEGGYPFLI